MPLSKVELNVPVLLEYGDILNLQWKGGRYRGEREREPPQPQLRGESGSQL